MEELESLALFEVQRRAREKRERRQKKKQQQPRSLNCRAEETRRGRSAWREFESLPTAAASKQANAEISLLRTTASPFLCLVAGEDLRGKLGSLPSPPLLRWRTSRKWRRSGKAPTAWSIKPRTKSPARWSR